MPATKKPSLEQEASTLGLLEVSAEALARLKRPRLGFERHFEAVVGLAALLPNVRPRNFDEQLLRDDLQAYLSLEAEEDRTTRLLARIKATRLARSARVWASMMDIYARARAAARSDPELAAQIADFQSFMKLGPRKKKRA
jgi:hypothetical protein